MLTKWVWMPELGFLVKDWESNSLTTRCISRERACRSVFIWGWGAHAVLNYFSGNTALSYVHVANTKCKSEC